jgi:hypothetical protein
MIKKLALTVIAVVCLLCPPVQAKQTTPAVKASKTTVKSTVQRSVVRHSSANVARVDVKKSIVKNSISLGIDPALGLSIAKSESGFKHDKRSSNGAVGVFQLLPSTAQRMGLNPYYLSDNIKGGLMYYKRMYDMFGSTELALAAYNAGPSAVKRYKSVPPYGETRRFVSNIMAEYHRQKVHPDAAIVSEKRTAKSKDHSLKSKHINQKNVTSKHISSKEIQNRAAGTRTVAKENTSLMKKTLAKQQNVKFVLIKTEKKI